MKIKTIIFAALFLQATTLYAENHMLIMGGGGEPAGDTTLFDDELITLSNSLKNTNWKYNLSFNGGHKETEQIMRSSFPSTATTSFTADNYKKMIDEYKVKIVLGDIRPGDQLMIIIDSHGAAKTTGETSHMISASGGAATNLNKLTGSTLVSLDDLQDLIKLTNEKGIKLGLVDLSCHSGSTLSLKEKAPNACIISATGPKHYSFGGNTSFGSLFLKNLKKGSTLESVFLKARADSTDAAFPMISTDENKQIVAEVYSSLTPYLYYYDPKADKLTDYILQNLKDCITCSRDAQFKSLIDKINELQMAAKGSKPGFSGEELKRLLMSYKKTQDELIQAGKNTGGNQLDNVENFSVPVIYKEKLIDKINRKNMTWQEIVNSEPDESIATFTKYREASKSPVEKLKDQAAIDLWKQIKEKKNQILTTYPKIKEAQKNTRMIIEQIGKNFETAKQIAIQEKNFYDELYRQKQSLNVDDPCRRIVF